MRSKKAAKGEKLSPQQLLVHCGSENAIFDLDLFGPGGSSRCIKFGEHVITPIEFEALAGKKSVNWKLNIRSDGKPLKTFFENGRIKNCDRGCKCDNCETGRKFPSNLELLIEKVYMKRPEFDLKIVKIEKDEKDEVKSKKKVTETKSKKEASKKEQSKVNNSEPKTPVKVPEKETNGKDAESADGTAPLNDVNDEFCSSPDPSPRKKRSSIETPMDEILEKDESELKEAPSSVRTRRASKRALESTPLNPLTAPDFDLNKEVAPLVNMPDDKIIPDEMAPIAIKQDPEMVKRRQQADIRSFFSPPTNGTQSKTTQLTTPNGETSPAKSDCSVELVAETETIKKVLEVDLTESPNKSMNNSLHNSGATTPEVEAGGDTGSGRKPRQILKRSPPSITKETLVRHTRGLRLQDRTEVIKQKHQQQREESVGRDKKVDATEQTRSGRSSRQSSSVNDAQVNGQLKESPRKEGKRGRKNDQAEKDLDKAPIELKPSEKQNKAPVASTPSEKQNKAPVASTPSEKQNNSINKRKSLEDDDLLKMLKEEKSLCLSPRKRVLREANKVEKEEDMKVVAEVKQIQPQRRLKRKLSEHQITAELEKSSPVPEKNKKEQEPPSKRQRRVTAGQNKDTKSEVPDASLPTSTLRRTSKEEKENSNTAIANINGLDENKEAVPAARKARKASKEDPPQVNPSNDLNKVLVTSKSNKEIDSSIEKKENKELNEKKELPVVEAEIPKPTFMEVENSLPAKTSEALVMKEEVKIEEEDIKHDMNGTPVKTELNDHKISPNKLPTYTTMIKSALEEMNVTGGEGCSKLEILLYILRKFRPKGNVNTITTKLIKILEVGTKKGDFLSSVSCPRVLKKTSEAKKDAKDAKDGDKKKEKVIKVKEKEKERVKKIKTKDGKIIKVKVSKLNKKEKLDKNNDKKEKKKRVVVQSPRKLKEPLSTICKAKKLTRHEVLKKIWAYIHTKKLQDPTDKTIIVCDENLKKLTKVKQISQKSLMSYIKPFMEPIK